MDSQIQELLSFSSSDNQQDEQVQEPPQETHLKHTSSITEIAFNFRYNFRHSSLSSILSQHRKPIILSKDSEPAYLLGVTYYHNQMEQFIEHFRSTIWMSYRVSQECTDVGWGCTIRAVQMVLAEVLKRNNPQAELSTVVQLFREGPHPFSLRTICKKGNIKQRWTGMNEMVSIINSMLNELAFTHSTSFNFRVNTELFFSTISVDRNPKEKSQFSFPRFIAVSNKIGSKPEQSNLDPAYIPHLQHLMKMNSFCGMVGGISGEALYVVGSHEDQAIVLDPHYVQETNKVEKFFKKTPRGISFNLLCSSFTVCFFLRDAEEYQIWIAQMCYSNRIYSPLTVCNLYLEGPEEDFEQHRKRSEDFQIL